MPRRSLAAVLFLTAASAALLATVGTSQNAPPAAAPPAPRRVLPGHNNDGFIQLPNQWRLRPAGTQLELGDFPVQIAVHPDGRYLAILHCGYRDHEVMIVDTHGTRPRIISRATVEQTFYGLAFSPDGKKLYASGGEYGVVHVFDLRNGYLSGYRTLDV